MMNPTQDRYKLIGQRIKEAREASSKSQKELAEAVGFGSATAISLIEAGERRVQIEDLEKMAKVLQRDIKFFIGQGEVPVDVRVALRADKGISDNDKKVIIRIIELAKERKHGK